MGGVRLVEAFFETGLLMSSMREPLSFCGKGGGGTNESCAAGYGAGAVDEDIDEGVAGLGEYGGFDVAHAEEDGEEHGEAH